jgi:large repetitive protein
MTTRSALRRTLGTALSAVAVLASVLVAAPAAHAASTGVIGTVTVVPASGTVLQVPTFHTSGLCPQASDDVRVKVYGGSGTGATIGAPVGVGSPKNILGTTPAASFVNGTTMDVIASETWSDWATQGNPVLTTINGVYTVRVWCTLNNADDAWFEGTVTFTGTDVAGATYTTTTGGPVTAPGAPTGARAVAGDAKATVTWAAPASNGGAVITGYKVTSTPGGKTCTTTILTCAVVGLTDGTKYSFTVTATNSAGTGAASAASNAVIPTGVMKKVKTKNPAVAGTAKVGKTVKAAIPVHTFFSSSGSIYAGITYTYQWKRGTKNIKGATKSAYKLVKADKGQKISVVVTAKKVGYKPLAAPSAAVKVK